MIYKGVSHLLNAGFIQYPESDILKVRFSVLQIFSVNGIHLNPKSITTPPAPQKFGENCTLIISNSINNACNALTGEPYTLDEKEWALNKQSSAPYLLIYFQECKPKIIKGGLRKYDESGIVLYDAFSNKENEIEKWEKESLPSIISSIILNLSTPQQPIKLTQRDRIVFGKSDTEKTVHNLVENVGPIYFSTSTTKNLADIESGLSKASQQSHKFEYGIIRHFYSALSETDKLKQFLEYAYFLEKITHNQYSKINYSADQFPFNLPERLSTVWSKHIENGFKASNDPVQRFKWCSLLLWAEMTDNDVNDFIKIKKLRDNLVHGQEITEQELPIQIAHTLSLKILNAL